MLRGADALLERMAGAARGLVSPPRVEIQSVVSAGELIVTLERFRACSPAGSLDQHVCVVWRCAAERCVEIWAHFENQPACDAFWRGIISGENAPT